MLGLDTQFFFGGGSQLADDLCKMAPKAPFWNMLGPPATKAVHFRAKFLHEVFIIITIKIRFKSAFFSNNHHSSDNHHEIGKSLFYYNHQWIGLKENLQETMVFTMKYRAFL